MRDVSEIEKLVEWGSMLLAILLFGTSTEATKKPIELIVSRMYGYIRPEVRKPIDAAVSRAYENAKVTRKSIREFLYNNTSLY